MLNKSIPNLDLVENTLSPPKEITLKPSYEEPKIFHHDILGIFTSYKKNLVSYIKKTNDIVLIDNGISHNFFIIKLQNQYPSL